MKEANEEEGMLRRYLLGASDEHEQERVEERFITDPDFKEQALMTEDELVEDYLAGRLPEAERELFVGHFLSTPDQRQKVRTIGALKRYLAAESPLPPTEPGGEVRPPGVREGKIKGGLFWRNPAVRATAALALLLVVVLGLWWLVSVRQRRNQLAEARRELEQLNRQPVAGGSHGTFLSPLVVRGGAEDENTLPRPAGGAAAQLWLLLVKDEYPSYEAVFQKEGDAAQLPISALRAETTPRGKAVPVRLPARLLSPDAYTLKLNGIAADGRVEEVGEYGFRVTP